MSKCTVQQLCRMQVTKPVPREPIVEICLNLLVLLTPLFLLWPTSSALYQAECLIPDLLLFTNESFSALGNLSLYLFKSVAGCFFVLVQEHCLHNFSKSKISLARNLIVWCVDGHMHTITCVGRAPIITNLCVFLQVVSWYTSVTVKLLFHGRPGPLIITEVPQGCPEGCGRKFQ